MNSNGKLKLGQPAIKQMMFIVLGTALILLVPLVAMQFTSEVAWDMADFALMGAILLGTGLIYVVAARRLNSAKYRIVLGLALAMMVLLVWAELAVGVFGTPFAGS